MDAFFVNRKVKFVDGTYRTTGSGGSHTKFPDF
jgi:hypothetical protein